MSLTMLPDDTRRRDALLGAVRHAAERCLGAAAWGAGLPDVLSGVGAAAGVDAVALLRVRRQDDGTFNAAEQASWAAPGCSVAAVRSLAAEALPARWADLLGRGDRVEGPHAALPADEQVLLAAHGIVSLLVVPIRVGMTWWGMLTLADTRTPRLWETPVVDAVSTVAGIVGTALRHAEARDECRQSEERWQRERWHQLERRKAQQAAVSHLGRFALAGHSFEAVLEEAVCLITRTLDADLGAVLDYDPADEVLTLTAGVGWRPEDVGRATVPADASSLGGATLAASTPVLVYDLREEERFAASPLLFGYGVTSSLSVRIEHEGRPFGVLGVHTRRPCLFSDDDVGFVQAAAHLLSLARENALQKHELARARDRAEEMSRLKSAFLGNMSHEVRTPLTSIIGFATLVTEEATAEVQEFAGLIRESGMRLLDTMNTVLELAQIESGSFAFDPEPIEMEAFLRGRLCDAESQARKRGLSLSFEASAEKRLFVRADGHALGRVMAHLLANAFKFTEGGGVVVRMDGDGDAVRVTVEDTGIGMSPDFLPHAFDEFRQESTGHRRSHEGNGLGLTIAKYLVERMGGHIAIRSQPGNGTAVTVSLPHATVADRRRSHTTACCDAA